MESDLAALAAQVNTLTPDLNVGSATLAAPGALEVAVEGLKPGAVVYPVFMANGWFVRSQLPRRLARDDLRITTPLGLEPGLPALAQVMITVAIGKAGWRTEDVSVLIAGHGSARTNYAAEATYAFSDALAPLLPACSLSVGFVEQTPTIAEAAVDLGPQTICLPFLARRGGHYREDVFEELANAGFRGEILDVIGNFPGIPALIAGRLNKECKP